jgi:hypothetical protein
VCQVAVGGARFCWSVVILGGERRMGAGRIPANPSDEEKTLGAHNPAHAWVGFGLAVHSEHHVDTTDSPRAFISRRDNVTDNLSKRAVGNGPATDDADMVR